MNRSIKDATVEVFHYEDLESLKAHVLTFVTACNFAKHLKALRWRTPYQTICNEWTNDPAAFKINPRHLIPGPHNQSWPTTLPSLPGSSRPDAPFRRSRSPHRLTADRRRSNFPDRCLAKSTIFTHEQHGARRSPGRWPRVSPPCPAVAGCESPSGGHRGGSERPKTGRGRSSWICRHL